ncbi:hypothetical protein FDECE_4114 [Fusarium decemcellulare]|nr:hypothetical protein FDECE_4114 [Fusarium decemcellulare]
MNADGTAKLVANDNQVLATTVGNIHGTSFSHHEPQNVPFTESPKFFAPGPDGAFGTRAQAGNLNASPCFLVGYSPYTLDFVFAIGPRSNTNRDNVVFDDNLTTLQFRRAPQEVIVGSNTIMHHSMTVPGNIAAIKKLFIDKDWERAFDGGDISVERAKELATESRASFQEGGSLVVVARISPSLRPQVPNNGVPNLEDRVGPQSNRRWKECLPEVEKFLLTNGQLKRFTYKVPYMSNMVYPLELYSQLTKFARVHPRDKFNAMAMLFAVQLWVDITGDADQMLEPFTATNQWHASKRML